MLMKVRLGVYLAMPREVVWDFCCGVFVKVACRRGMFVISAL